MLRFAGTVLLLLLLLPLSRTYAAENRHLDNIRNVLEASTLSRTEQAEVNARATAAMSAGVPGEDVEIIVARAVGRGADAGAINRFLDTGMSAKKEGLPVRPVLDRIEQGLSKGVPNERIVSASKRLAEKIATAQPLVDTLIRGGMTPRQGNEREAAIESAARGSRNPWMPKILLLWARRSGTSGDRCCSLAAPWTRQPILPQAACLRKLRRALSGMPCKRALPNTTWAPWYVGWMMR